MQLETPFCMHNVPKFALDGLHLTRPIPRKRTYLKFSSRSFQEDDQGKSDDIVGESMSILRERIEEVKKKEKEWNNLSYLYHGHNHKRANMMHDSLEIVGFAVCTLGLVSLSGSICIFLVFFLVHHMN
ncbi:hypothetical protein SLE2022_377130 [Rubroshorea leprosula]